MQNLLQTLAGICVEANNYRFVTQPTLLCTAQKCFPTRSERLGVCAHRERFTHCWLECDIALECLLPPTGPFKKSDKSLIDFFTVSYSIKSNMKSLPGVNYAQDWHDGRCLQRSVPQYHTMSLGVCVRVKNKHLNPWNTGPVSVQRNDEPVRWLPGKHSNKT